MESNILSNCSVAVKNELVNIVGPARITFKELPIIEPIFVIALSTLESNNVNFINDLISPTLTRSIILPPLDCISIIKVDISGIFASIASAPLSSKLYVILSKVLLSIFNADIVPLALSTI